jgi:hypothetical protein
MSYKASGMGASENHTSLRRGSPLKTSEIHRQRGYGPRITSPSNSRVFSDGRSEGEALERNGSFDKEKQISEEELSKTAGSLSIEDVEGFKLSDITYLFRYFVSFSWFLRIGKILFFLIFCGYVQKSLMILSCANNGYFIFDLLFLAKTAIVCHDTASDQEIIDYNIPYETTFSIEHYLTEMPFIHRGIAGYMVSNSFLTIDMGHFSYSIFLILKYYVFKWIILNSIKVFQYLFSNKVKNFKQNFKRFKIEQRKKIK